jgi:WHEP-TRS domain
VAGLLRSLSRSLVGFPTSPRRLQAMSTEVPSLESLLALQATQGDLVRRLKAEKASKEDIEKQVVTLKAIKAQIATMSSSQLNSESNVKKSGGQSSKKGSSKITLKVPKVSTALIFIRRF